MNPSIFTVYYKYYFLNCIGVILYIKQIVKCTVENDNF